jgi:hypothetical protein
MFGFFGRNRTQTYADPVEEFYRPHRGGKTVFESSMGLAYRMGKQGTPVTSKFLKTQADIYQAYLKSARRQVEIKMAELKARQKDPMRMVSFGLVFLVGLAVTTMAIFVDYTILEEIWSRNFANEFFEVPESLRSSVTFKSLQVVFAVLALHYFISHIGRLGRGIYISLLAAMVLTMLLGIGFLNTSSSLPIGSTLFGLELTGETLSAEEELAALGLESDTAVESTALEEVTAAPFGLTQEGFETAKTLLFFASFGLIFFFVSSVGALSLHYSMAAFTSFTGGTRGEKAESDHSRDRRDRDHSDLNMKLLRAEKVQSQIRHPEEATAQFLSMFTSAYTEGLVTGKIRNNGPKRQGLEDLMHRSLEITLSGSAEDTVIRRRSEEEGGRVVPFFGDRKSA